MSEFGKNGAVRQYNRSNVPRFRWTPELHHSFVDAIQRLGGQQKATPKLIIREMGVRWLTISQTKSHLQMYRNLKNDMNRQYAGQSNRWRRYSREENVDCQNDQDNDSLTYPNPGMEFQLMNSPPIPLKSQNMCKAGSTRFTDDGTQDIDEGKGSKDLRWQDAAESDYFKNSGPEKDQVNQIGKHNGECDNEERFHSSFSVLENEPDETSGCSLTLSLALQPKQGSNDSLVSETSCVLSSSAASFRKCSW